MATMDEYYNDGSKKHRVCPVCGLCMSCGDCEKYGCGRREKEFTEKTWNIIFYIAGAVSALLAEWIVFR